MLGPSNYTGKGSFCFALKSNFTFTKVRISSRREQFVPNSRTLLTLENRTAFNMGRVAGEAGEQVEGVDT